MGAFDYSRLQSTADRLIGRFGKSAVLRKPGLSGGPGFDPARAAPTFVIITCVETDRSLRPVDGRVALSEKVLLVRTKEGVTPMSGDQIMLAGSDAFMANPHDGAFVAAVKVGQVETLSPGPISVLFTIRAGQ